MTFQKISIAITFSLFLLACSQSQHIVAWIDEIELTQLKLDQYLNFLSKNPVNQASDETPLKALIESEALTIAIEKTALYQNSTLETELNELRKQALLERYLEAFLEKNLTETALKEFHASNANTLEVEQVHLAHILIKTDKTLTTDQRKISYDKANDIYTKLKKGWDFSQTAMEFSDDSLTASREGDLGWSDTSDISKLFSGLKLSDMNEGEISKPIQSRFGFHIVKLVEGPKMTKIPFNRVKTQLKKTLSKILSEQEKSRLLSSVTIKRNH